MKGKIYLIEYTVILLILTLFNRFASVQNLIITTAIVLIQYGFDKLRLRK